MAELKIQVPEKLIPLIITPKPLKIVVGGRGSGKSESFAKCFLKFIDSGERVLMAREFQNSIEQSVHSSLKRHIDNLKITTLTAQANKIVSARGGEGFYMGLARNISSIKSADGVNKVWIEEGQYISQESIDLLFPTIREKGSEIWISMNRGSSKDPIAKSFLNKAEPELRKCGFYEDDYMLIVEMNWRDNFWFPAGLEQQRLKNKEEWSAAKYEHIWDGAVSDSVEDAIIEPDWFDACVDAHIKLGFEALGQERITYDPADTGDAKALAYQHGSVVKDVQQKTDGTIDTATEWAMNYAAGVKPDVFIWDCDGIGGGLLSQVEQGLSAKRILCEPFKGSMTAFDAWKIYGANDADDYSSKGKTNKEMFINQRAQCYWLLRDRMFKTWLAVKKGKYFNPDELISFSSDISEIAQLRSELCRIPRKKIPSGRVQILSKQDMKLLGIDSPNMSDAVMMLQLNIETAKAAVEDDELYSGGGSWMS